MVLHRYMFGVDSFSRMRFILFIEMHFVVNLDGSTLKGNSTEVFMEFGLSGRT